MKRRIGMMVCVGSLAASGGCGSFVKEFAPIRPGSVAVRVPNQQRLLSSATLEAVATAAAQVRLAQYAGRSAQVEVNGVLPHSRDELLEYIAAAVEGEAARAGIRVIPRPRLQLLGGGLGLAPVSASPQQPAPDLRLVASVDWGGVDYEEKKYVVASRMGGQLGLLIGGLVLGSVAYGVTFGYKPSSSATDVSSSSYQQSIIGLSVGTALAAGLPLAALSWRLAKSPMARTFTLSGRARITLRAIPVAEGLKPAQGTGEGDARATIDSESPSGYAKDLTIPEKKDVSWVVPGQTSLRVYE